jgi:uncharacterized circularly permuted ATP-grasp superfamily protein/uncharacterized alpha-E superfamily protein
MQDPLLNNYAVPAGHFDELLDAGGAPRDWWASLAAHADLSAAHLASAQARVSRQMHENGVTYNVYAAADGPNRPWTLDVLPFVVQAGEWASLESGLRQRARLLNALAADLYGPQRVLREGVIPPALVFKHPGYLRACHGISPQGGLFVHLVAFDLARDPDGRWRVVNTRTQAPSGAGYALENRATIPRVFPGAFRDLNVLPLAPFFDVFRQAVMSMAPCDDGSPHVVLLTPGPYNETYFEHSYLAKHLGFALVEGADLMVRDDRVFLKTISGLRQVHAVVRRLDDTFCDPLELRADSTLGVPGLVQAWRTGHVLIANAFGTGVLESPALPGLLPAVSQYLLGEPLEIPSLRTRWAGDLSCRSADIDRLENGVIKPAFPDVPMEPVFLADLDTAGRSAWRRRFDEMPDAFVVEEFVPLSHAPTWHDGRLESRTLMLRVFVAADGYGGYELMPGGLSRIAGAMGPIVSSQRGGGSKDTWVLSNAPSSGTVPRVPAELARPNDLGVSSRAAEHLFWLGRYAERAETSARLLRAMLTRLSDPSASPIVPPSFLRTCLEQNLLLAPDVSEDAGEESEATVADASLLTERLVRNLFDRQTRRSLAFNVEQTARVAGAIRDRLSADNWRLLNQLFDLVATPPSPPDLDDTVALIDRTIVSLVAVGGLEMAHMTRDDGWRFLSVGRHLERLLFVAATLGMLAPDESSDPSLLAWLLELTDSLITFRARYVSAPEWPAVVDLLLFDPRNPRSILFQIAKIVKHVSALPGVASLDGLPAVQALESACRGRHADVETLLAECQPAALRLSDALTLRYFNHAYEFQYATTGR